MSLSRRQLYLNRNSAKLEQRLPCKVSVMEAHASSLGVEWNLIP